MDINKLAKSIVDQATGEKPIEMPHPKNSTTAMARRGNARAASLSPERRKEIAEKAANTRWAASKE